MNLTAATKIKMIKSSQLCLVTGLISLAALIGVPFALMALETREDNSRTVFQFSLFVSVLSLGGIPFAVATLVTSAKVRVIERKFWNAARPYRIAGGVCAMLAIVTVLIVIGLMSIIVVNGGLVRD
jgi:hypothetical protein